jgi:hypothetical protein
MLEHFGRHRKRITHDGIALLLSLLMLIAATLELTLGGHYERIGGRRGRLRRL